MEAGKPTDWREKYLALSEQVDTIEQRNAAQIEQLRRTLVRVSVAASGMDDELDHALAMLREELKKPELGQLGVQLDEVEDAVLSFENRKDKRQAQLYHAMEQMTGQLQQHPNLDSATKRQLKSFVKQLRTRLANQQEYAALCQELADLQTQIFNSSETAPAKGFFARFLGGDAAKTETAIDSPNASANVAAPAENKTQDSSHAPFQNKSQAEPQGQSQDIPSDVQPHQTVTRHPPHGVTSAQDAPVDLAALANRVKIVLHRLLDEIQPADCVAQKIQNARERIARGLNWYDLAPTLEDVRDLIMQSHLAANAEFMAYLQGVDNELIGIANMLRNASQSAVQEASEQRQFETHLSQELQQLSTDLINADNLNSLKTTINQRITSIRGTLIKPERAAPSSADQIQQLLAQVEKLEREAKAAYSSLNEEREKALLDPLTGLANREAYNQRSFQEWERWTRYQNPLAIAALDIDYFKKVNDNYGHQAGDRVLQLVSRELAKRLRSVDFIARYGGEEFVILLPETDKQTAWGVLDKLRQSLSEIPFHYREQPVALTVSVGVTEFVKGDSVADAFARADAALYFAKNHGRNRCCTDNDCGENTSLA